MLRYIAGKLDGSLVDKPLVIAVDLGFAQATTKSTGVAWCQGRAVSEPRILSFGRAVEHCRELLNSVDEAVMIVEAPLSGAFDSAGNPEPRRSIESENGKTRAWYSGPGAAVCLAAHFFLSRLSETATRATTVHLIEGFISFKDGSHKQSHADEALDLLKAFRDGQRNALAETGLLPINPLQGRGWPEVLKIKAR